MRYRIGLALLALLAGTGEVRADAFSNTAPFTSGSTATATGSTTARSVADRAADTANTADYGAACDGVANDAVAIQSAVTAAAAAGKRVVIAGSTGATCLINAAISVPSNSDITGGVGVTVKAGVSGTIFTATSATNLYIHDLTLNGNYPTTIPFQPVLWLTGVTQSTFDNLAITNPAGEIRLTGGANGNIVSRVRMTNSHQHGVAITASFDNKILNSQFDGQVGFGIIIQTGSARNLIQGVQTASSGLELVGITKDAFENRLIGNHATATGDNCYSVTGYRNTVTGNIGTGCQGNGIDIYGYGNTVTGNVLYNNAQGNGGNGGWSAGILISQGFGGISQHNVVTGNTVDDTQAVVTQLYGIRVMPAAYTTWATATTVAANEYHYNGLNLYQSTGAGTTGASAPTCTSGTCSDGTITWTYITSFDTNTNPDWNTVGNNDIRRFATDGLRESSGSTHNRGLRCAFLDAASSTAGTPANNVCANLASVVMGQFNTVTAGTSLVAGSANTVSGGSNFAVGSTNVVDASLANALGKNANTRGVTGATCIGMVQFAVSGDAQTCHYVLRANVTTTSATRLTSDGAASTTTGNLIAMTNNSLFEVSCSMIARNQSTGDGAEFSIGGALFRRDANVGTTAQVGSTAWTTGPVSAGAAGLLTPALIADTTNGGVAPSITATSGTWHVVARCQAAHVL